MIKTDTALRFTSKRARSRRGIAAQVGVGLLACLVTFVLLWQLLSSRLTSRPYVPLVSEKLAYFEQHKDDYDAIFIGSSRIYRQVSVPTFDSDISTSQDNVKSFNFGVFGMKMPETYFWLEKVLQTHPKKLKWVFVEGNLNNVYEPIANARTNRVIYWHTPEKTLMTLRYILSSTDTFPRKLASIYSHVLPAFYHATNVGSLSNRLSLQLASPNIVDDSNYPLYLGRALNGYKPLEEEEAMVYIRPREVFLKQLDTYRQKVNRFEVLSSNHKEKREKEAQVGALEESFSDGDKALIQKFSSLVQRFDAVPIFVVPPKLQQEYALESLHDTGEVENLLMFNDPTRYPDLFEVEHRFDEKHLNDAGATLFTHLLAEKFLSFLEGLDR